MRVEHIDNSWVLVRRNDHLTVLGQPLHGRWVSTEMSFETLRYYVQTYQMFIIRT
jgi:hypothetical protein